MCSCTKASQPISSCRTCKQSWTSTSLASSIMMTQFTKTKGWNHLADTLHHAGMLINCFSTGNMSANTYLTFGFGSIPAKAIHRMGLMARVKGGHYNKKKTNHPRIIWAPLHVFAGWVLPSGFLRWIVYFDDYGCEFVYLLMHLLCFFFVCFW